MKAKLYFFLFCVFVVENLFATNFKVEYRRSVDGKWWDITATSLVDNIVVSDVRVNRGNCKNDFNLRQKTAAIITAKNKPLTLEEKINIEINMTHIGDKWEEPKDLDYAEKYKKEILEQKIQDHKMKWQDKDGVCRIAKDWLSYFVRLGEKMPKVQLSQDDIKKMERASQEYFCPTMTRVYEKYYEALREMAREKEVVAPFSAGLLQDKYARELLNELSKEENLTKILPKNVLGFSMREKCPLCNVDTCNNNDDDDDDDDDDIVSKWSKNQYCDYKFDMDDVQKMGKKLSGEDCVGDDYGCSMSDIFLKINADIENLSLSQIIKKELQNSNSLVLNLKELKC